MVSRGRRRRPCPWSRFLHCRRGRGCAGPLAQDVLDGPHDGRGGLGFAEVLEHHGARPDLADRVGDALARRCRAPSRAPARTATGSSRSGLMLAAGRDADRAGAGRARGRTGCRRTGWRPTTTSNQSGCSTKCAVRMSMWYLSTSDVGVARRPSPATRSSQYGMVMEMPLRLGGRGQVLLRAASAPARRRSCRTRSTPMRVNTVSCMTISRSVPSNIRPPIAGVLALGVLAHDVEVDVAGLAAGQRATARPASAAPGAG